MGTQFAGSPKNRQNKMRRPPAASELGEEERVRKQEVLTVVVLEL
jgi:hypothetical protein